MLEAKRGQAALEEEQVLALAVVGRAEGVVVGEVSLHWLHRMIGRCDALNLPSARLLERLGMRREAYFLHNEHFKGRWGDELVYALLEDEWRARVSGARPG